MISTSEILFMVLGGTGIAAVSYAVGFFVRKRIAERKIINAEAQARDLLLRSEREAEEMLKRAEREGERHQARLQRDFENKFAEERRHIANSEKVLKHKEKVLDQKVDIIEKKEKETLFKFQEADKKEKTLTDREKSLEKLLEEERQVLQRISRLNSEEAKKQYLKRLEIDIRGDAGRLIHEVEEEAKALADTKAKKILSLAMQRCAASYTIESTVAVVNLPGEDMKGRIIGKDGRNIKTFETATGVDLVIDDTPGAVVLSAFDGVRREIARLSLEELIKDGRIQPARIEEVVQKYKRDMEFILKEEGEKAVLDVGLTNVHPEIVKLLGRLKFRTSYGQNVLNHSMEVAYLMNVIAGEMGIDPVLARRAGLLHDLGKAVSHTTEGPHALIGGELARRYGEHPDVIHGIEAHHEDIEMKSFWPMLVQAADAVSAARPGARRESFENYIKRLKNLEEIADKHPGVEKSYAIQAGREIRILVNPDRVPDKALPALAREIAKKIQENLQYPGQIKVTAIREKRVEEIAR